MISLYDSLQIKKSGTLTRPQVSREGRERAHAGATKALAKAAAWGPSEVILRTLMHHYWNPLAKRC